MTADLLHTQLMAYVGLREALGFQTRSEKQILLEFVAFVQAREYSGPIRAQMALAWACQESTHRRPSGAARRLSIARRFLIYLQAAVPETEVPAPGLLPRPRRPKPYLFTPTQLQALLAGRERPRWVIVYRRPDAVDPSGRLERALVRDYRRVERVPMTRISIFRSNHARRSLGT